MVINNIKTEIPAREADLLVEAVAHLMNWPHSMAEDQIQIGNLEIEAFVNTWLKSYRAGAFKELPANFDTNMEVYTPEDELHDVQI